MTVFAKFQYASHPSDHVSLYLLSAVYQWSTHVKRVTMLSLLNIQLRPSSCVSEGNIHIVLPIYASLFITASVT
jgi:hypothetical protein